MGEAANIFLEATNNIRTMHEIESILNNDDIPADSRSFFIQFITNSLKKNHLTKKQQKNLTVFREIYCRIDRDTRMFRTFLNISIDLAEHFKFENHSIVYAFKNISLEEHFNSFVNFALRRNPIIEKNSPLQLFITLGLAIFKLALKKNHLVKLKKTSDENKKILFNQYRELSRDMSERFLNMDFGEDIIIASKENDEYVSDLDNFNNYDDDDDDDNVDNDNHGINIETTADIHSPNIDKDHNNDDDNGSDGDDDENEEDVSDITKIIDDIKNPDDKESADDSDSGLVLLKNNDVNGDILKTLENGDQELNLTSLDSLVSEAGKQFGQTVLSNLKTDTIVRFNSNNIQNIVDFIKE